MADPLDSAPITLIDPTQEWTGSEIVSREIDPVLFIIQLLTTEDSLLQLSIRNVYVSCTVNTAQIQARQSLRSHSLPLAKHGRTCSTGDLGQQLLAQPR